MDEPTLEACKGHDPELWFPIGPKDSSIEQAKAICFICPVEQECLILALTRRCDYGIWGGKTEWERTAMRRQGHVVAVTMA